MQSNFRYLCILLATCQVALSITNDMRTAATAQWSTSSGKLLLNGQVVTVHGIGTTCTEYLLSGVGVTCFANYNWNNRSNIITTLDSNVSSALLSYLTPIASASVVPALRIPLTAGHWLDISSSDWSNNRDQYPNLSQQYRTLISKMVDAMTSRGVVVILDLHWNDGSSKQQDMALRSSNNQTGDSLLFWDAVAKQFGSNQMVWYELYNEPHIDNFDAWATGTATYAGMYQMYSTIRQSAPTSMIVIGGQQGYAYDADSLIRFDSTFTLTNVIYNFHPYMGPMQQSDASKSPSGFENFVKNVLSRTNKPIIATEFGQYCCSSDADCYQYNGNWNGQAMGYVQAILSICKDHYLSWLGWAWRPQANFPSCDSPDMNGEDGNPFQLTSSRSGKGANWAKLWKLFG